MSQASNLSSTQITNLDKSPPLRNTAGENAAGMLQTVEGMVTCVSGDTTSSTYKFVRLPTTAKVKKVEGYFNAASAGDADLNIIFSDSTEDGTDPTNQGTIPQMSSANNKLFGAAQSLTGAAMTEFTYANTTNFPFGSENSPLWKVLGYTTDPGGYFDIQGNVTTAVTTGGTLFLRVQYVLG